jgi:hypothetical protein
MRDFLQSAPWQDIQQAQGQEAPQQDDPFGELDLGILDPDVAAGMDPQQFSQQLSQTISQAAEQIADRQVEQRVGPVEQQLAEMQRQQDVASLVGEFPEIAEEDTAKQVLQAAGQLAEQGDISAPAGLESGAGATPGGGGGDLGDQIVGARAGRGVLPF